MVERFFCDVLVIGTGIAGLTTAIAVADQGLRVTVLTKNSDPGESNTLYAQGGIVGPGENDNPELLYNDIMRAGCYINNREAVHFIADEGPQIIRDFLIDKIGVGFFKDPDGQYQLTREAAHSVRRILHSKDKTGAAITSSLLHYAQNHDCIEIKTSAVVLDLITNCHHSKDCQQRYQSTKAMGAYVYETLEKKVNTYFSGAVVIAGGGVGNLYQHSSNPVSATGDGIAMAYRTGAEIINSEYIQFHPTTLYHRDSGNFLISESLRGEGAVLVDQKGIPFMHRYNKELKDLAPRDEVSRAIYSEMERNGTDCVFLDARNLDGINLKERFPHIYNTCMSLGIDMNKDLLPVVPAAHYFCGGIKVDLDGKTSISGLYAVGESACTGLHGANRLASVSLMEGVVFGIKAAEKMYSEKVTVNHILAETIPDWVFPSAEENFDSVLIHSDMITIQTVMWNYAGIKRSEKRLKRALSDLNYLKHRIERFYKTSFITKEIVELRNSVETASIICRAALVNPRSLGCHYMIEKGKRES